MLNILHAIDTPGPGGAETVYFDIVTGLDSTRFKSFPVIPSKGWLCDKLKAQDIEPIIVDSKGSINFGYLWNLIKVIRKQNIDLIHSHLFGSNVYCSLAGLLTATPVISTFHGFVDADGTGKAMRKKIALINKGSKKIVFVSQILRKHFIENHGIVQDRAEVIYNGIDTNKFQPGNNNILRKKLGLERDDILVGSIGNIRPAKAYDILLYAAAAVKKQRPDVKFVIAGQGAGELYQELLGLQERLDLKDTVFFLGFIENAVLFLQSIDVFLLCSTSEGFSLSLIEAMACGLQVIATRCGGPEEIISSDQEGILLDEHNPQSIARAVIALTSSSRMLKNNVKYPSLCIEQKFTNSTMVSRYSKLYERTRT